MFANSKDDRLPNLDATQHVADTENDEQVVATRERKHFPSNINKTGYVIFSVSCRQFNCHKAVHSGHACI